MESPALPTPLLTVDCSSRSRSTPIQVPVDGQTRNLEREYRAVVEEILELRGDDSRVSSFLRSITEPGALADTAGYSPDLSYEHKVELLQTLDVAERLELALSLQRERLAELQVRKRIRDDVESGAEKQQREYFLRKQMESIRKELGEDDGRSSRSTGPRSKRPGCRRPSREQADKELGRLERIGEQSAESSVIRTYLDWLIVGAVGKRSEERLDPQHAREVLDADHAGLEDVKDRIVEYIAVKKLRAGARDQRGQALRRDPDPDRPTRHRQDARSASRSPGRPDGSSCGCRWVASATRPRSAATGAPTSARFRAGSSAPCGTPGTMNPVIMLDEVDKVGADWRGDPRRRCSRCSTRPRTTASATTTSTSSST